MGTTYCASWLGPALHAVPRHVGGPRDRRQEAETAAQHVATENYPHVVPLAITISCYVLDSSPTFKEFHITAQLEALRKFSRKFQKLKFHLR